MCRAEEELRKKKKKNKNNEKPHYAYNKKFINIGRRKILDA